jgi:hypothetical protein
MQTILGNMKGQPAWRLATRDMELWLTQTGGQLGPVTFNCRGKPWQPYSIAPWCEETDLPEMPPILQVLRGDFFCMPFGGNARRFRGEQHPVHGETANEPWALLALSEEGPRLTLHAELATHIRPGVVQKQISLIEGHNAVYCRHVLTGMIGPMSFGHHAMLRFPEAPGSGVISTSRFVHGQVFVEPTERPEHRGYSCLKPGATFRTLTRVPTVHGTTTDLTRYPARRGYEDIAMVMADPEDDLAWTAVTFPKDRRVWFSLRDPKVLTGTILWHSNGGRHYPPWNGRHVNVLGLEDVTSYFHLGLAESARNNPFTERGLKTSMSLQPDRPFTVNYVMAAAAVPAGFARVARIVASRDGQSVVLVDPSGRRARVPLDLPFLFEGACGCGCCA